MPFRFSLQPVLDHRHALEDKAQRDYAQAVARVEAALRRKSDIINEIASRVRQARESQQRDVPFIMRELIENWIGNLEQHLQDVEKEIVRLEAFAEQMRLKLVKAVQNRMVLEKLRDKELQSYRLDEERAERRLFDEIAIRNYAMEQRREKNAGPELERTERIS